LRKMKRISTQKTNFIADVSLVRSTSFIRATDSESRAQSLTAK